jgi:uncharacterized lipoprotein YddW (UPF0748 family)
VKKSYLKLLIFSVVHIFLSSCKSTELNSKSIQITSSENPLQVNNTASPKYEMRGVWVSTVVNLDWPSKPDLSVEKQRNELVFLFDQLYQNGFNAVFFQIRTEADALYDSPFEPWSYFLTNEQGKAPDPFYDPLEFAIELAHERGMELHAWLNPFRTSHDLGVYPIAESHVINRHPEWVMTFKGSRTYSMLNPGIKDVRDYVATLVADIVRRYNVDGIHFDDYFYPYTPAIDNEDRPHFQADGRGISDIKNWRRDNINMMISQVSDSINSIDPLVKYGVSPFGIRLNSDAGTNGSEGYHLIYADPLNWLENQTIDYIAPQIYWEQKHPLAPYQPLMEYWASVANQNERHVYIGLAPYRLNEPHNWPVQEIKDMIRLNRTNENAIHGGIFFRALHVIGENKGLSDSLRSNWFRSRSMIPTMTWKDMVVPGVVSELKADRNHYDSVDLKWVMPKNGRRVNIYRYPISMSIDEIMASDDNSFLIGMSGRNKFTDEFALKDVSYLFKLTVSSRNGIEGQPRIIYIK